jgi:chromosome segregation ATPase
MNNGSASSLWRRFLYGASGFLLVMLTAAAQQRTETEERIFIAATNMEDAVVIDCQLPGKLRKLGGTRTYLTPGRVTRASAVECRTRGGEYTLGDLASGTLSLARWLEPANDGDAEAQYFVARIHANGMDNVPVNYSEAAGWYKRAADQGFSEAKQELGYLYERGLGVDKDPLLALNLQREAAGLGEELDYAWKIEEAERVQAELAGQLEAANASLQQSRLDMRNLQLQLAGAREDVRKRESDLAGIIAELRDAEQRAANTGNPERIAALQAALQDAKVQLADSQERIVALEQEHDGATAQLKAELIGGQATSLELRELLAVSRAETDTLRAELAGEQQRLIQSDEELRAVRDQYRDEAERLAAENERLLAARSRSESDVAAYLAAREADIASRDARVASLEAELQRLQQRLANTSLQEPALRQQVAAMQSRYEGELAKLRAEKKALEDSSRLGQEEVKALAVAAQQSLRQKEAALEARRREVETLQAASDELRSRVAELETRQKQQADAMGAATGQLQAELGASRKEVVELKDRLESMQTEKSALQAKLSKQRLELQSEMAPAQQANRQKIDLLEAEIVASESTINAQNLRISALETQINQKDMELASLSGDPQRSEPVSEEVRNALAVLDMARTNPGRYFALLIANEKYQNLPPLNTPVRDVMAIRQLLLSRYDFEVELLQDATDDQIMKALHEYANKLSETDNLLIYYAGRGSTPDGPPDRAYWLGVDSDPELQNTWLLAEHVSEKIKQIRAKHVLVVTDSCFSKQRVGSNSFSVGRGLNPQRFGLLANLPARLVLTSGANMPVTNANGDQTHSLFANYFIEVLRQNENVLSGEMLSHEMIFRVRESIDDPERATPTYQPLLGAGHGHGDFFFVPSLEASLVAASGAP